MRRDFKNEKIVINSDIFIFLSSCWETCNVFELHEMCLKRLETSTELYKVPQIKFGELQFLFSNFYY
jgi:hypothetical protein